MAEPGDAADLELFTELLNRGFFNSAYGVFRRGVEVLRTSAVLGIEPDSDLFRQIKRELTEMWKLAHAKDCDLSDPCSFKARIRLIKPMSRLVEEKTQQGTPAWFCDLFRE